jgi:hypothetical protein
MPFGGEELTHEKAIGRIILDVKNTRHASAGLQTRAHVYHDAWGSTPSDLTQTRGNEMAARTPRTPGQRKSPKKPSLGVSGVSGGLPVSL